MSKPDSGPRPGRIAVLLAALIALIVIAAGCQNVVDKAIEGAAEKAIEGAIEKGMEGDGQKGVDVDLNEDGGSIKTDEGELKVGEDIELPADFPENIPVHPKGQITSVSSDKNGSHFLSQNITGAQAEVVEYFNDEMKSKGWKMTSNIPAAGMSAWEDDKGMTATVTVGEGEEGKSAAVIATAPKQ